MRELIALPLLLLRGRFAREVMTLQVGSLVTMGTQFVTSVVIANLLGPSSLGVYAQAMALLSLVGIAANLAVGQAMVTRLAAAHAARDAGETLRVMAYFLKVGLLVSLVEAAVGLAGGEFLGTVVLEDPRVGVLARVLFVSPPLAVLFNMVILALQSTRQVRWLTILENGALIATSLVSVAVVALGGGVTGILYSVALMPAATSAVALVVYRWTRSRMEGLPEIGAVLRAAPGVPIGRYFVFSALVSIDKNFANLLALAPTLLLGRRASDAEVAYFRIAFNLMNFLTAPLAPVARNLYAKLSEIATRGAPRELGRSLLKVTVAAGSLSVVTTVVMLLLSPYILLIYRPEYLAAQAVMYVLGLRFALLGFGVGLGSVYQVLDRMGLAIATKVVPAVVMFGGGWMLVGSYGAVGAALALVLAYLVGDAANAFLVPWIVKAAERKAASSAVAVVAQGG